MDNKSIYNALLTIKECCTSQIAKGDGCLTCPLSVDTGGRFDCQVCDNIHGDKLPRDWKLNEPKNYKVFS